MKSGITRRPINPSKAIEDVMGPSAGGIVLFVGTIRERTDGRKVTGLEYEVYHEMAERQISNLENEIRKRWPITAIRLVHREGRLKVGEVSVVVAISAEHRGEAFEAARYAIERIKKSLPIWKREGIRGANYEWVKGTPIQDLEARARTRRIVFRHRRSPATARPKPSRLHVVH